MARFPVIDTNQSLPYNQEHMRDAASWEQLLHIEPAFQTLENQVRTGVIHDYRQVQPEAFAWHAWDQISDERLFALILPFLREQVVRAVQSMPALYAPHLDGLDPNAIRSRQDWQRLPILVKDDDPQLGLRGFRQAAQRDPFILRPRDLNTAAVAFGSGGSQGRYTPTFVTMNDRQREIQAWRRGHDYHGLTAGDSALYTYNPAHKGGQWMQESLWAHGLNVYLRRPEEDALQVLENLRAYGANILFTVQQPVGENPSSSQSQVKAAGINLHSLVEASLENPHLRGILLPDDQGRKQVAFIFLGGFEIVPYALEIIESYLDCTPAATLLGSSEAIPQACSTNPSLTPTSLCHYNNLHLLQSPHYIEILKPEADRWVPVRKGEQGLLVYTSWARDGTIWLRYAPGDLATLLLDEGECTCGIKSPVISGVRRMNLDERAELLISGCAAG
jgi:phenylacetate-CoA ligase